MTTLALGSVLALLGLGALHGVNPAMGWLFAVALGLQEGRGRAVWRALVPLALGHAVAIAAVVALAVALGALVPTGLLRWLVAATLAGTGVYRLFRHRHPRYGGMRVGPGQLAVWSFLMATAHGAGLMVLPFVVGAGGASGPGPSAGGAVSTHAGHTAHAETLLAGLASGQLEGLLVALVHTAGYLLVTGLVAVVVYEKLGLRLLRSAWINLDLLWSGALVATAIATVAW